MMDILITEKLLGPAVDELRQRFAAAFEPELWSERKRLLEGVKDARAILVRNQTAVNQELIDAARSLLVVGRCGVGLDNVDVEAATRAGVVVAFAPEQTAVAVAELTLGLMLSLARMVPAANESAHRGEWDRHRFTGTDLYGKTLGILGLGRIGYRTGIRARAFGMEIVAYDPYMNPDSASVMELHVRLVSLDELLERSDFVICHLPLTAETDRLLNYERFSRMKRSAYFVNVARGGIVDEAGLVRALREQRIAGAALDVRAEEPPRENPFAGLSNVLLTPHIASFTRETQDRVTRAVCADVAAILDGRPAKNFANFAMPRKSGG